MALYPDVSYQLYHVRIKEEKAMFYISASLFHRLLFFASQKGIKTDDLFKKANVDKSILANNDEKIPLEIYYSVMDAAIETTGDNCFGLHMGENANPGDISTLGYIMASCRTVREALEKIGKYFAIIGSTQRLTLIVEKNEARLVWDMIKYFPNMCIRHCIDLGLANTFNMLLKIAEKPVEIKEVWVKAGPPDDMSEYNRIFKCPILFNQPSPALVFPSSALDTPLIHPNPALLSLFEYHANSFLNKIDQGDHFSREISQKYFESIQDSKPASEKIIKDLGISRRVLRNKLREEGMTYSKLITNVRQELAKSYLTEKRFTIDDITYLVGFSEPRAFRRAFKRWTGMTASRYRYSHEAKTKAKALNS
jgi:AraC-like DNA-binding protein